MATPPVITNRCEDTGVSNSCSINVSPVKTTGFAKQSLNRELLHAVQLTPIDCQFGTTTEGKKTKLLQEIGRKECKRSASNVAILYVMRHPACCACREKGMELAKYAHVDGKIAFVTVLKDTKKLESSIIEYYQDYAQRSPIYKDGDWGIYKALGGRKVTLWSVFKNLSLLKKRTKAKNVETNNREIRNGDFWTKGGVLVLNKTGEIVEAVHEPEFGLELDLDHVHAAVDNARTPVR